MADNLTTQSTAPATVPASVGVASRSVTYSGAAGQQIAPVGLVAFSGADNAKSVFDLGASASAHRVAAGSGDATNVKASPGLLVGVHIFNLAAYPVYVKFHNTSGTPTPGAAVVMTVACQAGVARDLVIPLGRLFNAGIAFTIVKNIADADATAVVPADCVVDVEFN